MKAGLFVLITALGNAQPEVQGQYPDADTCTEAAKTWASEYPATQPLVAVCLEEEMVERWFDWQQRHHARVLDMPT